MGVDDDVVRIAVVVRAARSGGGALYSSGTVDWPKLPACIVSCSEAHTCSARSDIGSGRFSSVFTVVALSDQVPDPLASSPLTSFANGRPMPGANGATPGANSFVHAQYIDVCLSFRKPGFRPTYTIPGLHSSITRS